MPQGELSIIFKIVSVDVFIFLNDIYIHVGLEMKDNPYNKRFESIVRLSKQ